MARIIEDQKRKRSAVADDAASLVSVRLPAEARSLAGAPPLADASLKKARVEVAPPAAEPPPKPLPSPPDTADTDGKYHPLELAARIERGKPPSSFTVRVDTKAAQRWLNEHGVRRACLPFQFAHACKSARRWASCPHQSSPAHKEAAEGPHALVDGWNEAAITFVHSADRALFEASA
jgi:hypothetical protein